LNRKLAELFARLFDVSEFSAELSPQNVEKWDSFSHIELVMELERAFGLSIPAAEAGKLYSATDIQEYLRSKGAG
jgi:acyl carrier protein